ncbi:hypothetical protein [Aureimonas frigidaquae]|uniref:Uncharacterized protein n=1 Tax=Aureimonas frigidaquae TaxID=424757 RepID=A0A0N7KY55_9HYPH|nr:hypothetical protein [Aureimonas frigidaquae]BAT28777.1 hypothetical protein [Aureimonas frigidaquae]
MSKDALFDIAATLVTIARPGLAHRKIIRKVRERHPAASKKDVVKAAFYAIGAYGEELARNLPRR